MAEDRIEGFGPRLPRCRMTGKVVRKPRKIVRCPLRYTLISIIFAGPAAAGLLDFASLLLHHDIEILELHDRFLLNGYHRIEAVALS